jgi:transcriptional regulator with XRE-family HTH domain
VSTASAPFSELYDRLRQAISERHLTQKEAAKEIGVAERTIQAWLGDDAIIPHPRHRRALVAWLERDEVPA